ncbi:MAG: hypothetical protein IJ651_08040 [Bacteroidales bacterium]|nr:hypothetical protein [Bacteroidales bacterium]
MRRLFTALLLMATVPVFAAQPPSGRHTVRLGWGDMLFETLAFHSTYAGTYGAPEALPASFSRHETFDYGYTGHFFVEYLYRSSDVVSVGIQTDVEGIFWKEGDFDRYHRLQGSAQPVRNWDVIVMPTIRFTYLDRPWVRIYSGIGTGVALALDNLGGIKVAPALNLNWIGMEVGKGHWGGTFELGMLNALPDPYHIIQAGSRLFSASVYYKW